MNCSLCQEYASCCNCPLWSEKENSCWTYDDWHFHHIEYHKSYSGGYYSAHRWCPECKRLAAEMVRKLREVRNALALEEERKEEGK